MITVLNAILKLLIATQKPKALNVNTKQGVYTSYPVFPNNYTNL